MAFSIRKMLSNITYFSKPGEEGFQPHNELSVRKRGHMTNGSDEGSSIIDFERTEPDSTSRCANSLKLPDSVKKFAANKGSLSDTDLLPVNVEVKKDKRKKKIKLDVKKASQSLNENINNIDDDSSNAENTPKHVLLDCQTADVFSERFKTLNFSQSFDISDAMSESSYEVEDIDIESLSEQSDTEVSEEEKPQVKMCRKVESPLDIQLVPSTSPESFGDVEQDRNEEERVTLLSNYQMKLEKTESFLKKLLTEFEFHIEVSKIFYSKSIVTAHPGTDISNIPNMLGEVAYMDNINRGTSPAGSWNIITEKEDTATKYKLKNKLLSMKQSIDLFVNEHLQEDEPKKRLLSQNRSLTFDMHKGKRQHKQAHMSYKKKMKHFDFPDLREAMINLFSETDSDLSAITKSHDIDESDSKCICSCHCNSTPTETDSGLLLKADTSDQSITSSIGNFSLDSSTLSAYSESLDLIVSYNSFQDTSLYTTMLQKAAIERITFYVQVHSIQLKCESMDKDYESKNIILFHCPSCNITENEENGLLKHILSQQHCEKIHFQYKRAYIMKCMLKGKEIHPSSVLNPMKMYRDDNKIVCFGDAMYACSLCFENLIVGESILMAHCSNEEHIDKREKLFEMLE